MWPVAGCWGGGGGRGGCGGPGTWVRTGCWVIGGLYTTGLPSGFMKGWPEKVKKEKKANIQQGLKIKLSLWFIKHIHKFLMHKSQHPGP